MSKVTVQDAAGAAGGESVERRRSHRADLIVRVDYGTIDELFSEFTRDINEGGLFIETEKPKSIGTEVTMRFNLPGHPDGIETIGRVVRITSGDEFSPPGMGIEFDDLTDDDRARINALIRSLRSSRSSS
jgi:type IV pilus assembly protein PilZ